MPDSEACEATPEPLILAVDGATLPASVALLRGEEVLHEDHQRDDARMDAWLGAAIDTCFADSGVESPALDGFAVTIGPGTFTGIRVGIATCLGLAAPHDQPVCGVQTLEALAEIGRLRDARVAACIDARRRQVYGAVYIIEGPPRLPVVPIWGPAVVDIDSFADVVAGPEGATLILGSGAHLLQPADRGGGDPADPRVGDADLPLAVAVGRLAARSWPREATSDLVLPPPEPLYLRPPDARPPSNPLLEQSRK